MKTKTLTITITHNQFDNLTDSLCEEINSYEDYLKDGTFDHDQEEKEDAINRVQDLSDILTQLIKQRG